MSERKRRHGLQFYWIWKPIGIAPGEDGDYWEFWFNWHFYFHRKSMAKPLNLIYRWVAQVGPLGIRMWR